MESLFVNAKIVAPDEIIDGVVLVRDGVIADIDAGASAAKGAGAIDCEGDFLIPGLIDLHTDNLEKHFQPRPGVTWDPVGAAMAHDGQMAAAGVTTVFDSLSIYGEKDGFDRGASLKPMIDGVLDAQREGLLRIDHKLHLRTELSSPDVMSGLAPHLDNPLLGLISIMDHTPGQRQMRNVTEEQLTQMLRDWGRSEEEIAKARKDFEARIFEQRAEQNRAAVVKAATSVDVPLASHDDETVEHVAQALADGATIAEFPVTLEAAEISKARGLSVIMGAPNLLRGGSHSGNVAASEVAKADMMDAFASDYLPLSLLRAAFLLTEGPYFWSLPKAIATVTSGPAAAARLDDRGAIEIDKRADLVRARRADNGWPQPRGVWCAGARVA